MKATVFSTTGDRPAWTSVLAFLLSLAILLTGCAKERTAPGDTVEDTVATHGASTPEGTQAVTETAAETAAETDAETVNVASAIEVCQRLVERLGRENPNGDCLWAPDGSLFYADGAYWLTWDDTLAALTRFDSPEEAALYGLSAGDPKLYPYDHPLAGKLITVSAAKTAEVPYITVQCGGETEAYVCNYCAEATVDGKDIRSYVFLPSDATPSDPAPVYEPAAEDGAILLVGAGGCATVPALPTVIRNIIFLIADGGGYDNFQLADDTKRVLFKNGLSRLGESARTTLTNGRLSSYGYDNGTGLYLNSFLVGSSNTLLDIPHGSDPAGRYITDSSAAATALATGHKTAYCFAGINGTRSPLATLTELAQMNGMRTGVVSNKSFADATPLVFLGSHAIHRYEYQDTTHQALLSGVDVVLVEGTEYGDIPAAGEASSHLGATDAGYTVVHSRTELLSAVETNGGKVWGAFPGRVSGSLSYAAGDRAANHISYDIDAAEQDEPTLCEMTAAALELLGQKDEPNGFFLMVEAGALDNAAEYGKLRYAVGEALAFDETFAFCVEWAKEHGDNTLVIATADHDSGGFYGVEKRKTRLCATLIDGHFPDGTAISVTHDFEDYAEALHMTDFTGILGGHSDMPVPVWLYAPEEARAYVISRLGLPLDASPAKARYKEAGQYYDLASINRDYLIDNTAFAPVLASLMGSTTLDEATAQLFVPVATYHPDGSITYHSGITEGSLTFGTPDTRTVGGTTVTYCPVSFHCGDAVFTRNSAEYRVGTETRLFEKVGEHQPTALFITTARSGSEGVKTGTFYLPAEAVEGLLAEH